MSFKSLLLLAAASGVAIPGAARATAHEWVKMAAPATRVTVGTGNVANIQPPVPHPDETPCVVSLYRNAVFGANNVNFSYTPPASCPGPYATVVLSVDVALNAGIQYDRTGTIWLAGVPLWFGTTAEPSPNQAPSWHFERNVTDYTATLAKAQTGFVLITNYTSPVYTSVITSSAKLLFYPATANAPAPRVPDVVIPLAAAGGGTVALGSSTDVLSITPTLPTNIEGAALDVYLQGQSGDEFWYSCVPTAIAGELGDCGGGSLREGEITIDGTPAGVAPVSPWIFTGGIDPYLWTPIPGVQTLNFAPFRVELSPFAGVLSNGAAHTIGLSVFGANNYFSVAGALFLYLNANTTQVTGGVTKNTLTATPDVKSNNKLISNSSGVKGTVGTREVRKFEIDGTVVTGGGTTTYAVTQSTDFTNDQFFHETNNLFIQTIKQKTATVVQVVAKTPTMTTTRVTTHSDPLDVVIGEVVGAGGNGKQATTITQDFHSTNVLITDGVVASKSTVNNTITTQDTLLFSLVSGLITGNKGQASSANFLSTSTSEPCYGLALTASDGILTSAEPGCR